MIVLDQDFDGGQIGEQALDYLAEDERGNVWYLGSYTEAYEGGRFVNANDGWLDGVNGGKGGIYMPAEPKVGMAPYAQEHAPGDDPTIAKVVKSGVRTCVPFKCYSNVLVIEEGGSENKYFAPGVGGILTEPKSKGGEEETEKLINLTQLSRRGLAELSAEALKLDRHAASTVPDVFGASAARRSDCADHACRARLRWYGSTRSASPTAPAAPRRACCATPRSCSPAARRRASSALPAAGSRR